MTMKTIWMEDSGYNAFNFTSPTSLCNTCLLNVFMQAESNYFQHLP